MAYIYIIRNLKNGRVYIGSTFDMRQRCKGHLSQLRRGCHANTHLQNAWNKHGKESFEFKVIIRCNLHQQIHYEQRAIDIYRHARGWDNLYNINPIAGSSKGKRHSAQAKMNMSMAQKGKTLSEEHREKIATSLLGKKHSPERIANRYRPQHLSETHKAHISAAHKGKKKSPEHIAKVAEFHRGRTRTQTTCDNISKAHIGNKQSPESKTKISITMKKIWAQRKATTC